ncbi:hypothetical protein OIU84_022645 [Salix udensis]|uniref:Ycf2 N-terminal domain-containing protein n=1 Tax=Salix udensis TaxID=889485 RepID=A0AAD6KP25_9ROSI|nr:hypothetical protein OIU84_022645 [Salix udensis]
MKSDFLRNMSRENWIWLDNVWLAVQNLKDERHAAVQQTQLLQQELDLLRRRRYRKTDPGFSLMFAFVVGLVGIIVGFLLNLSLSSPSTD